MKVKYIKNWFSNMLDMDTPLIYQGIKYRTVENFYQAMKNEDIEYRKRVSLVSPYESKKMGRKVKLRIDWDTIKSDVMLYALLHKFGVNTSWRKKLLDCQDVLIVETNNWHDNYWGNCICDRCNHIEGENMLGNLLTNIRKEFRSSTVLDQVKLIYPF